MGVEGISNVLGIGVREKTHSLSTGDVETNSAHSSITANGNTGSSHHGIVAQLACPLAPLGILHFEQGDWRQFLDGAESTARCVQSTDEVYPPTRICLLEDACTNCNKYVHS